MSRIDELTDALRAHLRANIAELGNRVYDTPPAGALEPYAAFGPMDGRREKADEITLEDVTLQIDVYDSDHGRAARCRRIVTAIADALEDYDVELPGAAAVLCFDIESTRVFDEPDGIGQRGVVTVTARTEF